MNSNESDLPLDFHKALRLKKLVESGNFHLRRKPETRKELPKESKLLTDHKLLFSTSMKLKDDTLLLQHRRVWIIEAGLLEQRNESLSGLVSAVAASILLEGGEHREILEDVVNQIADGRDRRSKLMIRILDQSISTSVKLEALQKSLESLNSEEDHLMKELKEVQLKNLAKKSIIKQEQVSPNSFSSSVLDEMAIRACKDIIEYYVHKMEVLKLKLEVHRRSKPSRRCIDLCLYFQRIYSKHPNGDELWTDMFTRLVHNSRPRRVASWLASDTQLRRNHEACIQDLKREIFKISEAIQKARSERTRLEQQKLKFEELKSEQIRLCQELRDEVDLLRQQRMVSERERLRIQKEEEYLAEEREKKMAERRKVSWEVKKHSLAEFRRRKEEMEMEQHKSLQMEVLTMLKRNREAGLRRTIRIHFRKALSESKRHEIESRKKESAMSELEREARLETLRKMGRRRASLNKGQGHRKGCTVGQNVLEESICGPFKPVYGYHDEDILKDSRVIAENALREQGLLGGEYARRILAEIAPPSRPRVDTESQIGQQCIV